MDSVQLATHTLVGPLLALLSLALVLPGPLLVRRWAFLHRVPRAAMVLWQAGTVAALIAIIGAGVRVTADLWWRPPVDLGLTAVFVLVAAFALSVVARLAWSMICVARETGRRRARHRAAIEVLAQAADHGGLHVLAEKVPMAYCLPGIRNAVVVVSQGALDRLEPDEVDAVLAHERAHLRARHDVVLDFFTALHRAFPHAVRSDIALEEGRELIELLADDSARRQVGSVSLARALTTMAGSPVPQAALGAGGQMVRRVQRLQHEPSHPLLSTGVYALAIALVALPLALVSLS